MCDLEKKSMLISKEISKDNELNLYMNGKLIYKRWLNTGQSKVFDVMAYDKYTHASYTDLDVENSHYLILVKAKIRLSRADEGGRTNGIESGYRPIHVFEYKDNGEMIEGFMGDIVFENQVTLEPGKEHQVLIRFPLVQRIERFMDKGRKWYLHEGPRKIGEGEIIEFEMPKGK